jgi:hypothetical protein
LTFPGFQVKTPPGIFEVAVTVAVCPKQIAVFETLMAGLGLTVMVPDTGALGH